MRSRPLRNLISVNKQNKQTHKVNVAEGPQLTLFSSFCMQYICLHVYAPRHTHAQKEGRREGRRGRERGREGEEGSFSVEYAVGMHRAGPCSWTHFTLLKLLVNMIMIILLKQDSTCSTETMLCWSPSQIFYCLIKLSRLIPKFPIPVKLWN